MTRASHRSFSWRILFLLSRLILGGVFIYASIDKIIYPAQFAEAIYNYKILPTELVNAAALTLPWVELVAGLLLIVWPRLAFPSTLILTALTLIFIAAIGFNLARGLDFHCGCFSTSPDAKATGLETLIRDLLLLAPVFICLKASFSELLERRASA